MNPGISQSTLIVGAILGAFIIWLAVNGRLAAYYNVVMGPASGGPAPTPGNATIDPTSPNFNPLQWGQNFGCTVRKWFGGTC